MRCEWRFELNVISGSVDLLTCFTLAVLAVDVFFVCAVERLGSIAGSPFEVCNMQKRFLAFKVDSFDSSIDADHKCDLPSADRRKHCFR